MSSEVKDEYITPHTNRPKQRCGLAISGKKTDSSSIDGTLAMNRQRLQVLFSDIANLLEIHKKRGVPVMRAAMHLDKVDDFLEQLDQVSYNQLLTSFSLSKVQKYKYELEFLACELVGFIEKGTL